MATEYYVDGSFFEFPGGWDVEKIDEWQEQKKLTSAPFNAKACDLVALKDDVLWLVEVKDYTYPGAQPPAELAATIGQKVLHTLGTMEAVALWGPEESRRAFSRRAVAASTAKICLAIELPDGGRGLFALESTLVTWFQALKKVTRTMNVHRPVISNRHQMGGVPWTVRRDPQRRDRHVDR